MKRWLAAELLLLTLLAAAAGAGLAAYAGHWAWTWDGINHHVYLGLIAEQPRWHLDVLAANYQSYQYPYPYWPIYRIAQIDGNGALVAMLWAGGQAALLLPPVWLAAYRLLPSTGGPRWEPALTRGAACAMAFLNGVVVLAINNSANDIIATVPLLWALALQLGQPSSLQRAFWCAALYGVSIAIKWSNGLLLPVLLVWWWQAERPHLPLRRGAALAIGTLAGFAVAWLPWGWQLWRYTGNPFYPYFRSLFGGF